MRRLVPAFLVGAVVALAIAAFATAAARDTYKFSVKLNSRAEVPRPKGALSAKGNFTASYVENSTGAVLTWQLNYSRLTGNALAAHIHKGKKGVAGAVIVPLCGPCKNGQKGSAKISKAVISALESGGAYVNVHTKKNQAGEIRGQIKVPGA